MSRSEQPLHGLRILVTRPRAQARAMVTALHGLGAVPVVFPLIRVTLPADWVPLDAALHDWDKFDWAAFTSANGVRAVWQRAGRLGIELAPGPRIAAVGPATAAALRRRGMAPDFVPAVFRTEAIADGLGDVVGSAILLPRAAEASPALPELLRQRGARTTEVFAYRTLAPDFLGKSLRELLHRERIEIVCLTSPSAARSFYALLGDGKEIPPGVRIACIGPVTADALRALGLHPDWVAAEYTADGLVAAIVEGVSHVTS